MQPPGHPLSTRARVRTLHARDQGLEHITVVLTTLYTSTFILSYKLAPEARENRNHAGADSIGNGLVANGSQPLPAQTANSAAAMEGACISAAGWALHQAASVDVFWQNLAA